MRLQSGDEQRPLQRLVETYGGQAPLPILETLVTFVGFDPDLVQASLTARSEADGATTWRAVWLTSSAHLAFAEATSGQQGWTRHQGQQTTDDVTGWMRPLSSISHISVDTFDMGESLEWNVAESVHFRDGERLQVPLFGGPPTKWTSETVSVFQRLLHDAWMGKP